MNSNADVTVPSSSSVTEDAVHHVEKLIFSGQLEAGDTLPSETELAATLEISRLSVREALRTLQAQGLVSIKQGRRPTVAHPTAAPLSGYFSAAVRRDAGGLLELVEVRLAIEVHVAALAAGHATRADLATIEMMLGAMKAADDEESFNDADLRFHAAVASAGGNRLLSLLVEAMEEPLHDSRVRSLRGNRQRHPDSLDDLIAQHEEIFERIRARDRVGAADAMRKHLQQTRSDLRASFALPLSDDRE
ncbi:FadR family transcriptional regulator [Agromyces atrinae]|uniref:FadR/GntR family transcriptional regulator n=1 Tax=Agromyces atrinae TaxID=592376 RepID=UPI001F5789B9|nr:FadR/GntR family transcriptional regulator [Agromyces atrinae]MCI2957380.1 FadR family transcriptional regulator [Agromyces atrinae]